MLPLVKSLLAVVGLIALVGLRTTPVHFYKELKLGGGSGRRVPVTGPVESTYTCKEEHPKFSDQRLCVFHNLLLVNGTVFFVSSKQQKINRLYVSWEKTYEGDNFMDIPVVHPGSLGADLWQRAELVPQAGLFHQQHPVNYYHLFTEVVPTMYYSLCLGLGVCTRAQTRDLRIFWINRSGATHPMGYVFHAPRAIYDLLECLTPHPVLNVQNVTDAPLLLGTAIAGLPRRVRFYHQKREEWRARFEDPPPLDYMRRYRTLVSECLDLDLLGNKAPTDPIKITFINRHYEAGRSVLNAETIKDQILNLPTVRKLGRDRVQVNIVYLKGTLKEQASVVHDSSIYIWAHGAAMSHTFFLPKGAYAFELVQWAVKDPADQHVWVQGIRSAFGIDAHLDVITNDDRTKVFFNYDVLRAPSSQYHRFNDTEKVQLLENLTCPDQPYANGGECFGWFHWGMSLVLKFELLKPHVDAAIQQLAGL